MATSRTIWYATAFSLVRKATNDELAQEEDKYFRRPVSLGNIRLLSVLWWVQSERGLIGGDTA